MDARELAELRRDALQAVRDVLGAPDAKPADRLRAAEVVAKLEAPTASRGALELDDLALLAIARGEVGGTPRKGDPETPSAGAVPSDTDDYPSRPLAPSAERREQSAERKEQNAERREGSAGRSAEKAGAASVSRETSAKGTQKGPASSEDPGGEPNPFLNRKKGPDGTQKGPVNSGGPSALFAAVTQIGQDPEPWE